MRTCCGPTCAPWRSRSGTHREVGNLDRRSRGREANLLRNVVNDRLGQRVDAVLAADGLGEALVAKLIDRKSNPYAAADEVLERLFS